MCAGLFAERAGEEDGTRAFGNLSPHHDDQACLHTESAQPGWSECASSRLHVHSPVQHPCVQVVKQLTIKVVAWYTVSQALHC